MLNYEIKLWNAYYFDFLIKNDKIMGIVPSVKSKSSAIIDQRKHCKYEAFN